MSESTDIRIARRVLSMEIEALSALSDQLDGRFDDAVSVILRARGRVVCSGIGKSGHVARKIAATLASTGTQAYFVHPTEASHGDLGMISPDDVILALSRSGETAELSDIIHYARRFAIPLIGMTAKPASALGAAANIQMIIPDVAEACAETSAPTTSTTLMMALGDALAVALLERRGFKAENFKLFHPGGKLGSMLRVASDMMHSGDELPLAASGTALREAIAVMTAKGFGILGVTALDGALAGIVTDGDLRRYLASGAQAGVVDEIMNRTPQTAREGALAADLLRTMNERKITQVFVVAEGKPVGLVHLHDLLKAGIL